MPPDKFRPHNTLEYAKLLEWARGAKSILEIGSRYGYTLVDLAYQMDEKGRLVSVDLPEAGDWGSKGSGEVLERNIDTLLKQGYDAHLFLGDSKDKKIVQAVKDLGPYDFIFIDGDHRYEGVKADWLNYGPMGKRIVFHDIRQPQPGENQALEVWKLWQELGGDEAFIAPNSKMGIGRVEQRP